MQWAPAPKMGAKDSNVKDAAVVSFRAPMTGALLRRFCPRRFGDIIADKDIFELFFTDEDIVKMDGNTLGIPGLLPVEVESLDAVSAAKDTGICQYDDISEAGEQRIWHVLVAPGNPAGFKILLYRYTRQ